MLEKLSVLPQELPEFVLWLCEKGFDFESDCNHQTFERSFEFGVRYGDEHYWLRVWFRKGKFDRVLIEFDEDGYYKTTLEPLELTGVNPGL